MFIKTEKGKKMQKRSFVFTAMVVLLLSGCGDLKLSDIFKSSPKYFVDKGCEAVNFDSLLLSKGRAIEFSDKRSKEERNYQNGLWSVDEYCNMSKYNLTELIAEYGKRTKYNNIVSVNQGNIIRNMDNSTTSIEIEKSNLNYANPEGTFNFVAINGDKIIYFKENESVKLDGIKYKFINKKEYNSDHKAWEIEIINVITGDSIVNSLKQNKFNFGSYKIIF